jgi:hypothetical protein
MPGGQHVCSLNRTCRYIGLVRFQAIYYGYDSEWAILRDTMVIHHINDNQQ